MRRQLLVLVGAVLVLKGCALAPKYARPALPVPETWVESAGAATAPDATRAATDIPWQEYFADERLQSVIGLALANNRDLRIAALTIERAQGLFRIQRSELYPVVGALATADTYRLPEKFSEDGKAKTVKQYSVQVGLTSWELDLFGRIRSLKASALEQYFATEEARRGAQVSLVAAVASTYLTLAADNESLVIAQQTLDAHRTSLDLIERSRAFGMTSDLDYRQVQSQVEGARAAVAAFTGMIAVDRHALDVIVGAPVGSDLLPDTLGAVTKIDDLSPGLTSDVLLRRPDILATEHQLRAANANIGAARAAFFPRISLTAGVGTLSPDLSNLFQSGTGTWTFVPQLVAPIFTSGALKANVRVTEAERSIAVAQYEKAIQQAFREVSDALTLRTTLAEQRAAETSFVTALDETQKLSEARYKGGIDSYLSVLVADRALFAGQQALVNVRLAEQVNLVTLYKVLGGGV